MMRGKTIEALSALARTPLPLAQEPPRRSGRDLVRTLAPEIQAVLDKGYSVKEIVNVIWETEDILVSSKTLKQYFREFGIDLNRGFEDSPEGDAATEEPRLEGGLSAVSEPLPESLPAEGKAVETPPAECASSEEARHDLPGSRGPEESRPSDEEGPAPAEKTGSWSFFRPWTWFRT